MMIGDSIISAIGNTTPPKAARFVMGSSRRAMPALTSGSSRPISSQLDQVEKTVRDSKGSGQGSPNLLRCRCGHPVRGSADVTGELRVLEHRRALHSTPFHARMSSGLGFNGAVVGGRCLLAEHREPSGTRTSSPASAS
jgi:hypothetical protein